MLRKKGRVKGRGKDDEVKNKREKEERDLLMKE